MSNPPAMNLKEIIRWSAIVLLAALGLYGLYVVTAAAFRPGGSWFKFVFLALFSFVVVVLPLLAAASAWKRRYDSLITLLIVLGGFVMWFATGILLRWNKIDDYVFQHTEEPWMASIGLAAGILLIVLPFVAAFQFTRFCCWLQNKGKSKFGDRWKAAPVENSKVD